MGITAVLINYKRLNNTYQIIDRLLSQTVPVNIIVWNNGAGDFKHPDVDWVINSSRNVHGHVLPYLYRQVGTEFILRMDDDLIPTDDKVIEDVLIEAKKQGVSKRIICGHGVQILDNHSYKDSRHLGCGKCYPKITEDTYVDIAKGRFTVFRTKFAKDIPFNLSHIHADLTTSFALSSNNRLFHIIPQCLEGRLVELNDEHDDGSPKGYSSATDHYDVRDLLVRRWITDAGQY